MNKFSIACLQNRAARATRRWLPIAVTTALLSACGGGGSGDASGLASGPSDCSIVGQNQFVYDYLRDFYFWADEVADNADPSSYNSPSELLEDLKFKPIDRYSVISDAGAFNSFQEGQFTGIGLFIVRTPSDDPIIAFAHANSPAARSGLKRGDLITEINGVRGESLRDRQQYNAAFGPSVQGNEVTIKVQARGESTETTHELVNETVTITPTLANKVIEQGDRKIGYFQFTNFFANAVDDLNARFSEFAAADVDDLVIDLRYNGGGRLSTATHLASLIGGARSNNEDFARLLYNQQHPELNFTFRFTQPQNNLSLQRVFILSTDQTCSASEALANGLRGAGLNNNPATPIEVVIIGETSCGKPVGSNPQAFCDSVMPVITFELRNARNQGEYFNGLTPNCEIADDLEHDLGDSNEAQLAAALHFIDQSSCPVAQASGNGDNGGALGLPEPRTLRLNH